MSIFKMSMNFLKLRKIFVGVYKLILFMEIGILMTDPSQHLLIKKKWKERRWKTVIQDKKNFKKLNNNTTLTFIYFEKETLVKYLLRAVSEL